MIPDQLYQDGLSQDVSSCEVLSVIQAKIREFYKIHNSAPSVVLISPEVKKRLFS